MAKRVRQHDAHPAAGDRHRLRSAGRLFLVAAGGSAHVAPVKGVESFNRASPVTGPTYVDATTRGKRIRRGAKLWTVSGSTFKAETYRFLRLPRPSLEELEAGARHSPGTVHLPSWIDSEWCKQFVGEQLVTVRTRRGFSRLEWQKLRERNEALDCRVYARAAAWIVGADRWPEATWRDLEVQFGMGSGIARNQETGTAIGSELTSDPTAPARVAKRTARRLVRRVRRSSWMA